ncbi:MAG: DUF1622 domain-containing protein [Acidimicrobiia bacterium]|nr:DUF1622 domain-containing protein [Acidimicrobiia bacterium]
MDDVARVFEATGVGIISVGAVYAVVDTLLKRSANENLFDQTQKNFGRPLILGLSVLVAADIIETVIVDRTPPGRGGFGRRRVGTDRPELLARHRARWDRSLAPS